MTSFDKIRHKARRIEIQPSDQAWKKLERELDGSVKRVHHRWWLRAGMAASVLLLIGLVWYAATAERRALAIFRRTMVLISDDAPGQRATVARDQLPVPYLNFYREVQRARRAGLLTSAHRPNVNG